jgi:hypothetical protein
MGERGHTIHVLGDEAAHALPALGQKLAILGKSPRWTSFVPVLSAAFDPADASRVLDAVLLQVWFDDDHGVVLRVYGSGALMGELSLPGSDDDDDATTTANLDLLEKLEQLEVLTKPERTQLLKHMANTEELRTFAMAHGVEKIFGLPFWTPMPVEISEEALLPLLPEAVTFVVGKDAERSSPAKSGGGAAPSQPLPSPKTSWTAQEKQTLALHCSYWSEVWSMNNFRLYNCYKKHLRAAERPDVDRLADAVARGDTAEIGTLVSSILARIWTAEDWDKIVRDPKLVDGDDDEWSQWRARLPH